MFGVEVHANFLRTFLEQDFLVTWDGIEKLVLLVVLAVVGVLAVMLTDTLKSTVGVFLLIVILWLAGFALFSSNGLFIPLIMAFFGAPLPQVDHAARACRRK